MAQNITCETPLFPVIYEHMKPIIPLIQDALDYGHQIATGVLKTKSKKKKSQSIPEHMKIPSEWIHSHLVRWAAQTRLSAEGLKTKFCEEVDGVPKWDIENLPNNGLAGDFDGRKYRILKGVNGELPAISLSSVKKKFYRQEHIMKPYLLSFDGNKPQKPLKYNVVFLWNVHPKNYIQLYLSCPRYWINNKAYDYFTKLLSHPVEAVITNREEPTFEEDNIPSLEIQRIDELQGKLLWFLVNE